MPVRRSAYCCGFGAVVSILLLGVVRSANNGLALTPPRGWLAWGTFRCQIDCKLDPDNCIGERLFRSMADRMHDDGWVDLGYRYLNIDDWYVVRMLNIPDPCKSSHSCNPPPTRVNHQLASEDPRRQWLAAAGPRALSKRHGCVG